MKIQHIRVAGLLALISFGVSGCAETADGRKTQTQGTAGGAVLGAAGGALLGYIIGGPSGAAQGAAAGAVVGGAQGFAYGSAVAARKAQYASAEKWIDQEIALARQTNARAIAYNQSLQSRLANLESRANAARLANDRSALRKLKSEVGAIQNEAANQGKSETQYEKDQSEVLGNAEAKASPNYAQYRQASQAWSGAKSERATLVNRTASLRNSIGG